MSTKLSIVVPVHNEADFVAVGIAGIREAVDSVQVPTEIIVVENGSSDATRHLAEQALVGANGRIVTLEDADYGQAMFVGFSQAGGEWVVNFDIDYYSRSFLEQVIGLEKEADVIIGSKRDPESHDERSLIRRLATRVFNLLLRILFSSQVSDTHGIKGFRLTAVKELLPVVVSRQDLFDTELVLRAERAGLSITEVPVEVIELRASKSSIWKRVPRTLAGLWQLRRILSDKTASDHQHPDQT